MLRRMRNRVLLAAALVGSLFCVVGFARRAPQPERALWEYTVSCGRADLPDLNRLGVQGWEMAAATQEGAVSCLYFKRRR